MYWSVWIDEAKKAKAVDVILLSKSAVNNNMLVCNDTVIIMVKVHFQNRLLRKSWKSKLLNLEHTTWLYQDMISWNRIQIAKGISVVEGTTRLNSFGFHLQRCLRLLCCQIKLLCRLLVRPHFFCFSKHFIFFICFLLYSEQACWGPIVVVAFEGRYENLQKIFISRARSRP